jgi:tetratricopeptide (TPR) repeat protein
MKNTYLLACLCMSLYTQAQNIAQNGQVRLQNSGKKPVAGVQIRFIDANPTESDATGKFKLIFSGKKAGDWVVREKIYKEKYTVVNDNELDALIALSNTNQFAVDIILTEVAILEANKRNFYNICEKVLLASFEEKKKALQDNLKQAKLTQANFDEKYRSLRMEYEKLHKKLNTLSDELARVNTDDISPTYKEALELLRNGEINESLQKLQKANLLGQMEKVIKEEKNVAATEKTPSDRQKNLQKQKEEIFNSLRFEADIYALRCEEEKANIHYDKILALDSNNVEFIRKIANFYQENYRLDKSILLYPKVIQHPKAEEWQRATAYGAMGEIYANMGNLDKALENQQIYVDKYTQLVQKYPQIIYYQENLAVSYAKLGEIYGAKEDLDKATEIFEKALPLCQKLHESDVNNLSFAEVLAIVLEKSGNTYMAKGDLDKALTFFERRNQLSKELHQRNPANANIKNGLAVSYLGLGSLYENRHSKEPKRLKIGLSAPKSENLAQAKKYYQEAENIYQELVRDFPQYVSFQYNFQWVESQLKALE